MPEHHTETKIILRCRKCKRELSWTFCFSGPVGRMLCDQSLDGGTMTVGAICGRCEEETAGVSGRDLE